MAQIEESMKCLCCNYRSNNEKEFLKHVKVHRFEPNFRIPCLVCPAILKNFDTYRKHTKQCVKVKKEEVLNEKKLENTQNLFWKCQNCPQSIEVNVVQNIVDFQKVTKHIYTHSRRNERYMHYGCKVSRLFHFRHSKAS